MTKKKRQMCPLFPDQPCPRGEEASRQCEIRINGEFDPVLYFRDELVLHCALHRVQKPNTSEGTRKETHKNGS